MCERIQCHKTLSGWCLASAAITPQTDLFDESGLVLHEGSVNPAGCGQGQLPKRCIAASGFWGFNPLKHLLAVKSPRKFSCTFGFETTSAVVLGKWQLQLGVSRRNGDQNKQNKPMHPSTEHLANGKAEHGVCPGYCCLLGICCLLAYDISRHLPAEKNPALLSPNPSRKAQFLRLAVQRLI